MSDRALRSEYVIQKKKRNEQFSLVDFRELSLHAIVWFVVNEGCNSYEKWILRFANNNNNLGHHCASQPKILFYYWGIGMEVDRNAVNAPRNYAAYINIE